jgi:polar amino acid transport system substrate-binding protein
MRRRTFTAVATGIFLLAGLTACSTSDSSTTAAATPTTGSTACPTGTLPLVKSGQLTVATDSPAYPPYFIDNNPSNGKGYESAVAYAIAGKLGFTKDQVKWVVVPFNSSYAPGKKTFDFDINQISITPARQKAANLSDSYYTSPSAVVAIKGTTAATATSIADLQKLKIGVQQGTTSLQFVQDTVKPTQQPAVFNDTAAATSALKNKQIDAIVVDLPTADYISNVELSNGKNVGQFSSLTGDKWGLLSEKGSALTGCLNSAIQALTNDGSLKQLQDKWLPFRTVPEFTQ